MHKKRDPAVASKRSRRYRRIRNVFIALGAVAVVLAAAGGGVRVYEFWDDDPERGAITVARDVFEDKVEKVRYLDQNWAPEDSLWFYNTTQGSDLLPYDFFMALEQVGKTEPFRSSENFNNRYRCLPQKPTSSNPDGLPVGFVRDDYQGKAYLGLTCAACHTGQVNYRGVGMRIDGGPSAADLENFSIDLAAALRNTLQDDAVRRRFVDAVLRLGSFKTEGQVLDELKSISLRLSVYALINDSPDTRYGYFRLDAFGRIYNRVLEHVLSGEPLREILNDTLEDDELKSALKEAEVGGAFDNATKGRQRAEVLDRIIDKLPRTQQLKLRNRVFSTPDAPVSFPFLWDTPQHDYVQWHGGVPNAGLGALGRNAGEVVGVFATLDWAEERGITLASFLSGQGLKRTRVDYRSSVNPRNLKRLESHIGRLRSPRWPADVLPPIDPTRAANGQHLFVRYCAGCHAEITRDDPDRRVVAHLSRLRDIGTDPHMAENSAARTGYSGILRNQYAPTNVGHILLDQRAPVAAILTQATTGVVAMPDPDKFFVRRGLEGAYDLVFTLLDNDIKESIKHGNYDPDTTESPFASLLSYKARSLNGIWATAPYLHNGSVPTLYDLLLPKRRPGDPPGGEYRPDEFQVGSREFNPDRVGFATRGYAGFKFDTALPGNANGGHEYGARPVKLADGTSLEPLTHEQRLDLLEYLKGL